MVAETKHIIEKVRVKLTTPSVSEAHELKNDFSSYFSDYVLPYIEDYLDELFQGKSRKVVRMNQLKLSLSLDDVLRSKDELTIQLKKLLDDQLKVEIEKENNFQHSEKNDQAKDLKILDSETHYFEAFCFFLERGNCPWWLSNEKLSFLLEEKNLQTFFSS
ncbi:MAG TPA: contractile injection system tape measure protein, partial [Brumimicrobium sp.]|nr:contractile injection system tape measure protein [Brumimicrobium sp.]